MVSNCQLHHALWFLLLCHCIQKSNLIISEENFVKQFKVVSSTVRVLAKTSSGYPVREKCSHCSPGSQVRKSMCQKMYAGRGGKPRWLRQGPPQQTPYKHHLYQNIHTLPGRILHMHLYFVNSFYILLEQDSSELEGQLHSDFRATHWCLRELK